jgi:hypothetical protein
MHSLGSAQRRIAKNMAFFDRRDFFGFRGTHEG